MYIVHFPIFQKNLEGAGLRYHYTQFKFFVLQP